MLKLNRLNGKRQVVECLINVESISGITEITREPVDLYNEDGELVETKERESLYQVQFKDYREIYISKETYQKLLTKLSVEEL